MFYDRKIKYLDYYENGERTKGCGFVKVEVREQSLRMEVSVTGVYDVDSLVTDVLICSETQEKAIGKITILGGKGEYRQQCHDIDNICGTGIRYENWEGIRILLGPDKEISCRWRERRENVPKKVETPPREIQAAEQTTETVSEKVQDEKRSARRPVKLMEDKWQQLCAIYPRIRPFRDQREYLSIGPGDFVLFPAASYKMVNNSFLLHGFYNYHHLILTRVEKKGEICYYIGAPGNFFEREKQVAIMFGFESFECAEEPAQTGDFGYYMMRTEL